MPKDKNAKAQEAGKQESAKNNKKVQEVHREPKKDTKKDSKAKEEKKELSVAQNDGEEKEKSSHAKEKKKRKRITENSMVHQIMPVVLIALCAFLGICFYTTVKVGFVGEWLNQVFYGSIGCAAYFVPPMVFLSAILWQRDAKRHMLLKKLLFAFLALVLIAILFYTFGMPENVKEDFSLFWRLGEDRIGGGFLGDCIGFALNFCLAKTGTVILALLFLVVVAIMFFDFRPNVMFAAIMRSIRSAMRTRAENRKREAEVRAAEKEEQKSCCISRRTRKRPRKFPWRSCAR